MALSEQTGGAARHPEDTEDRVGEFIHGEERDEGVGELTPLPEDAGGDTPPENDTLAELEEAVGRTLSDDLTADQSFTRLGRHGHKIHAATVVVSAVTQA